MHEQFVSLFPCIADAGSLAIGYCDGVDGIGVLMVESKNVIVATTRGDVETTCLIGIGFQERGMGEEHNSNLMGTGRERWSKIVVDRGGDVCWEKNRTSGANVLGLLILMAECSGDGFREVFANELSSEAREGGEVTATDGTQ